VLLTACLGSIDQRLGKEKEVRWVSRWVFRHIIGSYEYSKLTAVACAAGG
jgi:hypothetical protein